MDHTINYKGSQVGVTELVKGPSLVLAESVDKDEWNSENSQCPSFPWWQWLPQRNAPGDPRGMERRGY